MNDEWYVYYKIGGRWLRDGPYSGSGASGQLATHRATAGCQDAYVSPSPTPEKEDDVPSKLNIYEALATVEDVVMEVIRAGGEHGVPGAPLHAALTAVGMSQELFELLMAKLVRDRRVRRSGDRFFVE